MGKSLTAAGPLTIGIDARAATEVTAGRGRVVRELLRGLNARAERHRYLCFARRRWDEPLDGRFEWRLIGARDPLWHALVAREASRRCDVFLSTNSYLSVMLLRCPAVAIVHDLIAYMPEMRPRASSAVIERLTLGPAVRRARSLVCVSEATAHDLLARYPAAAGRTSVALLGVSPALDGGGSAEAWSARLPPPGFVLAVGTLEPRKNLPRLVQGYARLPVELQKAHPLVVVGPSGWATGETEQPLRSLGSRCLALGRVSDAELAELYRRCAVFCYPSLGEGFGLPVLEAMAAGAPVLTSKVSSLPEVGGEAVAYVDPLDADDIARGLRELLTDERERERLARAAPQRARLFSWDAFSVHVLAVLEAAARPPSAQRPASSSS